MLTAQTVAKTINTTLVREDASIIIVFPSQAAVNIILYDHKALKLTKEKNDFTERHNSV